MTVQLSPGVLLEEVDGGGILLNCSVPTAAFVSPTALNWVRGAPILPGHEADHARCLESWRSAGLVRGVLQPGAEEWAGHRRVDVPHPVLVVASSPDCGYCRQLRTDLAANRTALAHLGTSVLLVGEGSPTVWGSALEPALIEELTVSCADLGRAGTPSAVRLTPGGIPRVVRGFDAVTATLVELGGSEPELVVREVPTSCSVAVNGTPVDALVIAQARGRAVGIAARGEESVRVVTLAARGSGTSGARRYVPVTLLVERPRNLWLVFRGGELVFRSRSASGTVDVLGRIVAGFAPPGARQSRLLCGALVHTEGRAMLFPRDWMSYLVERGTLLARAGWRPCPDPFTCLEAGPDGTPVLSHPSRAGLPQRTPVEGVLAPRPEGPMPGSHLRARLLAQIVNWAVRPVTPAQARTVCALVADLPVHLGTREEALAFLTRTSASV